MIRIKIAFSIFIIVISSYVEAQQLLGQNDGLTYREVNCIIQDLSGKLWIGTEYGLNSYDGYIFKEYHSSTNSNGLSDETIQCFALDSTGNIWIGTKNGLNRFNVESQKFDQFFPKNWSAEGINFHVMSLQYMSDGSFWMGTANGSVYKLDVQTRTLELIVKLKDNQNLRNHFFYYNGIRHIVEDENKNVWITSRHNGIKKYFLNGIEDTTFQFNTNNLLFSHAKIILNNDEIVLLATGRYMRINRTSGKRIDDPWLDSLVKAYPEYRNAIALNNQKIWMVTSKKNLIHLDLTEKTVTDYSHLIEWKVFVKFIQTVYVDQAGLIWLGTQAGLLKVLPIKDQFENYFSRTTLTDHRFRDDVSVRGMIEGKDGSIFVGSYRGGILRINSDLASTQWYKNGQVARLYPYRITTDTSDGLYFVTENSQFLHFDPVHGTTTKVPNTSKGIRDAYSMKRLFRNEIWIGTVHGLYRYSISSQKLDYLKDVSGNYQIERRKIWDIQATKDSLILLATDNGLFGVNRNMKVDFHLNTNGINGLSHNEILCIHEDENEILWLGSRKGLNKLNRHTGEIETFTESDGLLNNVIYSILESDDGRLWMGTNRGLSSYDKETRTFKNFLPNNGLKNTEYNHAAALKSKNGRMYFGGLNGIDAFYPFNTNDINAKKNVNLYLTKFIKHDGRTDTIVESYIHTLPTKPIELSYQDRFVAFEFSLAEYYQPKSNTFSYKLEGYENTWMNLGRSNKLRINELPPGKYVLHLKGMNANETIVSKILTIPIWVNGPIHHESWFILSFLIFAVGLIVFVVWLIVKYKIRQLIKLQKLRTDIASDLHDEVGGILTRISIHAESAKRQLNSNKEMDSAMQEIAGNSRLAASAMSDVLWSIDGRNDKLGNMLDRMSEHLEETLTPINIKFHFKHKGLNVDKSLNLNLRQNIFLIFKEAINNVAKHSLATTVWVILINENRQFQMKIADNGERAHTNNSTSGQGIRNMKMRAKRIDAVFKLENDRGYRLSIIRNEI